MAPSLGIASMDRSSMHPATAFLRPQSRQELQAPPNQDTWHLQDELYPWIGATCIPTGTFPKDLPSEKRFFLVVNGTWVARQQASVELPWRIGGFIPCEGGPKSLQPSEASS